MTTTATTETFQERVARWLASHGRERREAQERRDAFIAKLRDVQLDGWRLREPKTADAHVAYFDHPDTGAAFYIELPGRYGTRHGKTEASASWPDNVDGSSMVARDWGLCGYNEADPHRIGFSVSKSAGAIQRDLERRLVPGILEAIGVINAKLAERTAGANVISKRTAALVAALPPACTRIVKQTHYNAELSILRGGSAYLNAGRVDLKLSDLTHEQALAVAKLYTELTQL